MDSTGAIKSRKLNFMRVHSAGLSSPAVTRRSVLAWAGAGFSAAAIGIPQRSSGKAGAAADGHPTLHRRTFAAHLGEEFTLTAENQPPISCQLAEITEERYSITASGRFVSFSLFFSCPSGFPEGRIYRVSHSRMSDQELFLSPVGAAGKNQFMEAVVSLRTDA